MSKSMKKKRKKKKKKKRKEKPYRNFINPRLCVRIHNNYYPMITSQKLTVQTGGLFACLESIHNRVLRVRPHETNYVLLE